MMILSAPNWAMLSRVSAVLCMLVVAFFGGALRAAELPLAAGSPLVGFSFEDRPLMLPIQRNFQMAMLTASSEIGRSCGKMEAYGWRMAQSEQQRVDQVFHSVVSRLRGLGYVVEAQNPPSVSSDITMFTADRADRHFLFMSSAGEIGLVLVLCESSPALVKTRAASEPVQVFTQDVMTSGLNKNMTDANVKERIEKFSPVGEWIGSFTCAQGYTGATLHITSLRGENFEGSFRFYPTAKNPYAGTGKYTVYGQYDRESKRILINPGKWLDRPAGFVSTVMVGGFDPVNRSFSGYFQGINGCTSFEGKAPSDAYLVNSGIKNTKQKQKDAPKPKKVVKKKASPKSMAKPVDEKTSAGEGAAKPAQETPLNEAAIPSETEIKMETATPIPAVSVAPPAPQPASVPAAIPPAADGGMAGSSGNPAASVQKVPDGPQPNVEAPTPVAPLTAPVPSSASSGVQGAPVKPDGQSEAIKLPEPPPQPAPVTPPQPGADRQGSALMPVSSPDAVVMPSKEEVLSPITETVEGNGPVSPVGSSVPLPATDMTAPPPTVPTAPAIPNNIVLPSVGEPAVKP